MTFFATIEVKFDEALGDVEALENDLRNELQGTIDRIVAAGHEIAGHFGGATAVVPEPLTPSPEAQEAGAAVHPDMTATTPAPDAVAAAEPPADTPAPDTVTPEAAG